MTDKEKQAELEKAQRPDDEEDGKGEEENEDDEDAEKGCSSAKKSEDLSEDDLEKSLGKLNEYVESGDTPTRKQALLDKAQKEELTKSEATELFELLGSGEPVPEKSLKEEVEKAMEPSEEMQKALDVSEFLDESHEENKRVNTMLADHIEKSDARQHAFNLVLAKAVANIGKLVQGVNGQMEVIGGQPVRKPKSQGAKPLEKSFANGEPSKDTLSKSEILDTMGQMIQESVDAGNSGAVGGVDLVQASTKYEMLNQIHPQVLAMVQKKRGAVQH